MLQICTKSLFRQNEFFIFLFLESKTPDSDAAHALAILVIIGMITGHTDNR